ncbi:MAG: hypothetical protein U9Q16_03020, partial [Patescibacteria group bacterium]|nr:hypothetical protein [Patescibacteria group bacterium]
FPPAKKKRKKFFEQVVASKYPVIFYESPYRILKTLDELRIIINSNFEKNNLALNSAQSFSQIVVCRELTKKFETIYRGNINDAIEKLKKEKQRGEFAVVINR